MFLNKSLPFACEKYYPPADGSTPGNSPVNRYEHFPLFFKILLCWDAAILALYILYRMIPSLADFINTHVSSPIRIFMAKISSWYSFSMAEILLYLIPVLLVVLIVYSSKKRADSWKTVGIWVAELLTVAGLILSFFALSFTPGYYGATLDKKLGLDSENISVDELYNTALLVARQANEAAEAVDFGEDGFSVMPYDLAGMNKALMAAYDTISDQYAFIPDFNSRVKPVLASKAMSYTHITGVYTYFTGEANINVDFPDYTIPYTAAHELAHQRGIAREDEANFMAYLVCLNSEDPYLRYCADRGMFEYLFNALYDVNQTKAWETYNTLCDRIKGEWSAYVDFFNSRENEVVSTVSHAINDTYLKSQGTEGSVSYDLVVWLTAAYYRDQITAP